VVPKFADLFNNLGAELPPITVFMLSLGLKRRNTGGLWRWFWSRAWCCCCAGNGAIAAPNASIISSCRCR